MTYRGILSNSWFTKRRQAKEPCQKCGGLPAHEPGDECDQCSGNVPIPPPAESFEYNPLDSEPLPVGKSATREDWRERGYGDE